MQRGCCIRLNGGFSIGLRDFVAGLIVSLLTIGLASYASARFDTFDKQVSEAALITLSRANPHEVCVDARRRFDGAVSEGHLTMYCFNGNNALPETLEPYPIDPSAQDYVKEIKLLCECGAIDGGYMLRWNRQHAFHDHLPFKINGNNLTTYGADVCANIYKFEDSTFITTNYYVEVNATGKWPVPGHLLTNDDHLRNSDAKVSSIERFCGASAMCSSSIWKFVADSGSVWLKLHQNRKTAECLVRRRTERYHAKYWNRSTSGCNNETKRALLLPREPFVNYNCTDGVDDALRNDHFLSYRTSLHERMRTEFLGKQVNYDQMWGLYTGAFTTAFFALIGSMAALLVLIATSIVVCANRVLARTPVTLPGI